MFLKTYLSTAVNPHSRVPWGTMDLNTETRKILNGGSVSLMLLASDY
jgi:hypothetical protein